MRTRETDNPSSNCTLQSLQGPPRNPIGTMNATFPLAMQTPHPAISKVLTVMLAGGAGERLFPLTKDIA